MKKDTWKNNLGLKFAALLFSILLWWSVVNIDDPIDKRNFVTDVELINTDIITNQGKSFQIVKSQTITVTVKARRKVLESIKTSDIEVIADFTEYDETTELVPIRVKVNGYESRCEEVSANPKNLQLKTEDIVQKTFPVHTVKTGEVRNGYVVANMTPDPQYIDVSGPGSVVNQISKVVAKVDVLGLSKTSVLAAELIYYDYADNVLDKTALTTEYDKVGVGVTVEVWGTKTLDLKFDTSEINVAKGYVFDRIEVEPQSIKVAGSDNVIISMDKIEISKEALKTEELNTNQQVVVDVAKYLPDGIVLADQDASSVVVTIIVEKAGIKTISIPTRSIKVDNVSEEFEITYDGVQDVELKFEGANDALQSLTADMIEASIDLDKFTAEGTYDIPVHVKELQNQCKYLGGATVQITLKKK